MFIVQQPLIAMYSFFEASAEICNKFRWSISRQEKTLLRLPNLYVDLQKPPVTSYKSILFQKNPELTTYLNKLFYVLAQKILFTYSKLSISGVGQNVAWALTKHVNFTRIIDDLWYRDINKLRPGRIDDFQVRYPIFHTQWGQLFY